MGIDLHWENETGEVLEAIYDPVNYLGFVLTISPLEKTTCLRFIDPYGNTVFNHLQIPDLVRELQAAQQLVLSDQFAGLCEAHQAKYRAAGASPTEISEHLSRVMTLARRCGTEQHTYLKFYGD
jgi:hypothetical protein